MLRGFWIAVVLLTCATTARADTIVLANGDEISGEILEWAVDFVVIEHPQLGELRLSLDQLKLDTEKPPNPGFFGTRFLRGWNRNINVGFNGKAGNSNNRNLTLGMNFNYGDAFKRWALTGRYFFNSDEEGTSDNNARFDLRRDWLVPESRWFGYTAGRYQYDQFESWEHRVTMGGGPGFHIVERERHKLDALSGYFYTREFGDRETNEGEVMFGLEYAWTPPGRYSFRISNQAFVQSTSSGDLRNLTIAELKIRITEDPALNFLVGAENEYESSVESDDKHNDTKYFLTLGLDF